MNSFFLLFTVITFNSFFSYAQVPVDSLMIELNEVTGRDQVDLLNQYSDQYLYDAIEFSQEFAQQAYRLSEQINDLPGKGKALLNRGKIAFLTGNPFHSIQLLDSALVVARALKEIDWQGEIFQWLARSYKETDELEKSLSCYQSYFDLYEKMNDRANMALALIWKGDLMNHLDRILEARTNYQQALQYFTELQNQRGRFITLVRLARLNLNAGFREQSKINIQRADEMVQGIDDPELLLSYFQAKAAYYMHIAPDSALYYYHQALRNTENSKMHFARLPILKEISDLYKKRGEYDQAESFDHEYSRLYDSLYQVSELPISGSEANPDSDSFQEMTEINKQTLGADRENGIFLILIMIGSVFLLFSITFFIMNLYRLRKANTLPGENPVKERNKINLMNGPENDDAQKFSTNKNPEISGGVNSDSPSPKKEADYKKEKSSSRDEENPDQLQTPEEETGNETLPDIMENLILILDENLNIKFANGPIRQLLQYEQEELTGKSIDVLLKDDESKNEMIFKKITQILENGEKAEVSGSIPVVFRNKSGTCCHLHAWLALYQQESQLFILFQFFTGHPDLRGEKEDPGNVYMTPIDLKEFYEVQGSRVKEYLNFVFNQYLSVLYRLLRQSHEPIHIKRKNFYLPDISEESGYEVAQIPKIFGTVKGLFTGGTNDRIRFHEEIKNDEIRVRKKEWIFVILYVILKNAVESIRGTGDIYFVSLLKAHQYQIKFVDTGEGLPKDQREKAFKPFFSTKSDQGNFGLGLSLAREIMKRHQGSIRIRSKYGRGTEVILKFPMKNK